MKVSEKVLLGLLALLPGMTLGEEAVTTNEAVQVTAAPLPKYRTETTDAGTLVELPPERSPFTVDSLTEDFIRERNTTDLDQLITLQPGIYQGGKTVMARQAGTYTIRGYSGSEVLLGGVPLAGGVATFLDPTLLERVDIVKGPVGGAYGAQMGSMTDLMGAGGTVILQPKRASFEEDFYDFLLKGSYSKASGTRLKFATDVNQVFEDERLAVRVPMAYEWREPGWAPSDAGHGRTFSAAPSLSLRVADRLEAGLDLFYQYSDQPAFQGVRTLYGKPYGSGWDDTYTRPGDRMRFQTFGGTFRLDGDVTDWLTLRTRLSFFQTENRYDYRGPYSNTGFAPDPASNKRYEWGAGDRLARTFYAGQDAIFKFDTWGIDHQFLVGVSTTVKESQGWGGFTSTGRSGTITEENYLETIKASGYSDTRQQKVGINVQDLLEWHGLSVIAGVRADWHDSVNHVHEWTFSPRLGISYDILEAGRAILFANVSLTETPNFNYKRWPDNTGTSPSDYLDSTWRAVQKEAGIRVNPTGSLWLTGTVFRIDQSNAPIAMDNDLTGEGYYSDDGKTYSQGVELSASGDITDNWSIYLAYAYIDYYDKTNGLRFDRFPPHAVSLWTSYKAPWFYDAVFGFGCRWRDAWMMTFRGQPAGEDQIAKRLLTFDASVDFPFTENFSLGLAVRNIFDSRGVESARNLQTFANDGRTFELSLRFRF